MFNNFRLPDLGAGILILVLWEAVWKGIGLWKSAKRGEIVWFLAIFLINFFGIVPLFYLYRTKQLEGVLRNIQTFFKSKLRFKK